VLSCSPWTFSKWTKKYSWNILQNIFFCVPQKKARYGTTWSVITAWPIPLTRQHLNNILYLSTSRVLTSFSFCLFRGKVSITLCDCTETQSERPKAFRGQLSWLLLPQQACVFPSAQIFNMSLITQFLACSWSCVWSSELSLVCYYVVQIICHTQTKAHTCRSRYDHTQRHIWSASHIPRHTHTHLSHTFAKPLINECVNERANISVNSLSV